MWFLNSLEAYETRIHPHERKSEVMRTPEHKRSVKNGANSDGVKASEMHDNAKQSIGVSKAGQG